MGGMGFVGSMGGLVSWWFMDWVGVLMGDFLSLVACAFTCIVLVHKER